MTPIPTPDFKLRFFMIFMSFMVRCLIAYSLNSFSLTASAHLDFIGGLADGALLRLQALAAEQAAGAVDDPRSGEGWQPRQHRPRQHIAVGCAVVAQKEVFRALLIMTGPLVGESLDHAFHCGILQLTALLIDWGDNGIRLFWELGSVTKDTRR